MASIPLPDPGPIDSPPTEPTVPPSELPTIPDDIDRPAPISEPGPDGPGYR